MEREKCILDGEITVEELLKQFEEIIEKIRRTRIRQPYER